MSESAFQKAGTTKKRYKGLDKAPKYVPTTLTSQHRKDYSFKAGHHLSIVTQYPHSLIGLENLTDIRDRTRGKTGQEQGTCRLPLMCQATKPKRNVCEDIPSCGGA